MPVPVILGGDFNTEPGTAAIVAIEDSGLHNVATGPDYLTWDPVKNHDNQGIGSKRGWPASCSSRKAARSSHRRWPWTRIATASFLRITSRSSR